MQREHFYSQLLKIKYFKFGNPVKNISWSEL